MVNFINNNLKNIIALSLIFNFSYSNDYVFETKWCISTVSEFKNNLKNMFCIVDYRFMLYTIYTIYMILVTAILSALTLMWISLDDHCLLQYLEHWALSKLITVPMILLVNNLVFNICSSIFPWLDPQTSRMLMISKCFILALSILSCIYLSIKQEQKESPGAKKLDDKQKKHEDEAREIPNSYHTNSQYLGAWPSDKSRRWSCK